MIVYISPDSRWIRDTMQLLLLELPSIWMGGTFAPYPGMVAVVVDARLPETVASIPPLEVPVLYLTEPDCMAIWTFARPLNLPKPDYSWAWVTDDLDTAARRVHPAAQ